MMHYSNPDRENDPYTLPDIEIFKVASVSEAAEMFGFERDVDTWVAVEDRIEVFPHEYLGFYWRPCFPGCLPDGDPIGPFPTWRDALDDARGE